MPRSNSERDAVCANPVAPANPAEVFCAPPCAAPAPETELPAASGHRAAARDAAANRAPGPPGRALDEVMRAFREERRLAQAEGEPSAVISQILARVGNGSLAADLAKRQ